ncbi:MAG: putative glycoside hydrolase [Candidatus Peribacteraceae bacterium]|nr:putative glycoside hydrolase [Candidatus Peribacteraceae bacterium]
MNTGIPCIVGLQEIKCDTRFALNQALAPVPAFKRRASVLPYLFFAAFLIGVGSSLSFTIFTDRAEEQVALARRRDDPVNPAYPVPHWSPPESSAGGCNAVPVYTDDAEHAVPDEGESLSSSSESEMVSSSSGFSSVSSVVVPDVVPVPPLEPLLPEVPVSPSDSSAPSTESSSSAMSVIAPSASSEDQPVPEPSPSPEQPQQPLPPVRPEPVPPPSSSSAHSSSARFIPAQVGVFLTEGSVRRKDFLIETMDALKTATGAALIFNVKGSAVYFDSDAPLAKKLDLLRNTYDLKEVISLARERGIYTIGRFIAVKDSSLAQSLPETQIRHPKTNRSVGSVWVDPSNPSVITYNKKILEDLVAYGIDEVNLDYIRYPTEYSLFSIGLTGREKADHLEEFIRMARTVIDEHGGKTKLGISTYAILGWEFPVNFEHVGQDIARLAPYVDVISPMAYPATFAAGAYYNPSKHPRSRMYYLVYRTLTGYAELLGPDSYKLRPWIQGYGITAKNIRDEIDAVFDAGACGFTVWNASNAYNLVYGALPEIHVPERCLAKTAVVVDNINK